MQRLKLKSKKKKKDKAEKSTKPEEQFKEQVEEEEDEEEDEESTTLPPSLRMASGVPNYKIILCGEYGVGKSSIFRRFLNNSFTCDPSNKSTIGLDQCTRPFSVGRTDVKLTLWDTGGMERMSFIGSSYYRGAHAALLVYNSNNKETFSLLSQYILDIVMNAEGAKIFLCGNECDSDREGDGKDKVSESDMDAFMSECQDVLSGVYEVSCKAGWGLGDMFEDMARVLHTDALNRATIRRDLIRPGETPELTDDQDAQAKKRCC